MSGKFITVLCFAIMGGLFAGCQQKAEDAAASAPATTRAESDGLTQAPGAPPAPQTQMPAAGSMGTAQPATGAAGAKDDH